MGGFGVLYALCIGVTPWSLMDDEANRVPDMEHFKNGLVGPRRPTTMTKVTKVTKPNMGTTSWDLSEAVPMESAFEWALPMWPSVHLFG